MRGSKWKAAGLLGASALCTGLGGFQQVMVTSWLQPIFLLRFLHVVQFPAQTSVGAVWILLLTIVVQSLGFTVAFAGMFNDPSFTYGGVITVFFVSLIAWSILSFPFFASTMYRQRFGGATLAQYLVFPSIWTALWHLEGSISPLGTLGNPAYSQAHFQALVLTISIWGMDGVVFLMAWAAAIVDGSLVLADSEAPRGMEASKGCAYSLWMEESKPEASSDEGAEWPYGNLKDGENCSVGFDFSEEEIGAHAPDGCGYREAESSSRALNLLGEIRNKARNGRQQHTLHLKAFSGVFLLALLYTGCSVALFSGSFFQKGIPETLKPTVGASCILGIPEQGNCQRFQRQIFASMGLTVDGEGIHPQLLFTDTLLKCIDLAVARQEEEGSASLWNETQSRIEAGDAFILWSEIATIVQGDEAEAALLFRAAKLAREGSNSRQARAVANERTGGKFAQSGPYLGISYIKYLNTSAPMGAAAHNVFSLILPNGSVGFKYTKSYPVPFVEADIMPGPGELKVVDTDLGRIGGAICFDYEFPDLIQQAGRLGVDIMLQPSWTWGPGGSMLFDTDSFRAVENGFTLLRCSSVGVSGVVTPFYRVLEYREALERAVITMELPIVQKVWTLYPVAGFLFGWAIMIVALLFSLLICLPLSWVCKVLLVVPHGWYHFLTGQAVQCQNHKVTSPWGL